MNMYFLCTICEVRKYNLIMVSKCIPNYVYWTHICFWEELRQLWILEDEDEWNKGEDHDGLDVVNHVHRISAKQSNVIITGKVGGQDPLVRLASHRKTSREKLVNYIKKFGRHYMRNHAAGVVRNPNELEGIWGRQNNKTNAEKNCIRKVA